jgi:hypothetical protein
MTQKALRLDDSNIRNSIEFVLRDKHLQNAARVINPTEIGAKRQFISKNPRLHGKQGSQSSIVNEKMTEGVSMFAKIDKKAKEMKSVKD